MKLLLSFVLFAGAIAAQTPPKTVVQDVLIPASSRPISMAMANITWPQFTYGGQTIAASDQDGLPVPIAIGGPRAGSISVSLVPTDQTANNAVYTVRLYTGGVRTTMQWSIPTLPSPRCAHSTYCTIKEVTIAGSVGPSSAINPSQISTGGSTSGQVLCNVAGIASWCGGALVTYRALLSGTSITLPAGITGLGPNPAIIGCYDDTGAAFEPGGVTLDAQGDLTITAATAMTGTCVLAGSQTGGAPGEYIASLSGTSVTVLATVHQLGAYPAVGACYDGSGAWFAPGGVAVDSAGNITITSISTMTGKCVLLGQ